ncbi:MAG: hypothetical protein HQL40_08165 [Alphaproteobacteria bacterium]|nr:hypothetical protein [Alphaproteobacteria bacterium]
MTKTIVVIDTSILCVLLAIPGKETCGRSESRWTRDKARSAIAKYVRSRATLVLPLATIIETGNHIAQANGDRYSLAAEFCDYVRKAADATSPWAAFTDQARLWDTENLASLAGNWPTLAASGQSIGDATIVKVADYYAAAGYDVKILTGDEGLESYAPTKPRLVPRRRQ